MLAMLWEYPLIVTSLLGLGVALLLSRDYSPAHPVADPASSAILITGTSSGIGRHCALTLCQSYLVFATVRKQADADDLLREEKASGRSCRLVPLLVDVAKPEQVEAAVETVRAELRERNCQLAALVNNAAVNLESKYMGQSDAVWPAARQVIAGTLEVNVVGLLDVTRTFLPLLIQSKGRIVNIGSYFGSFTPLRLQQLAYGASKYAVEAISDGLRRGLRPEGVAVVLLKPGNIVTEMNPRHGEDSPHIISDAVRNALTSTHPPSRMYVGRVMGWSMALLCRLLQHAPDWVTDAAL